ncbi:MAG: 50S ribosomal protein L11 methyltransferase [Planctomycetia bacterium]
MSTSATDTPPHPDSDPLEPPAARVSAPQSWTEIRVLAPLGWHELVAEALAFDECSSVAFGRSSLAAEPVPEDREVVRAFVSSKLDTPAFRAKVHAALEALAEASGAEELADLPLEFKPLPPEDYANSWKKSWKPFRVGRIAVHAPWSRIAPRSGDLVMVLEPGATFGSGRHPTTRLCLDLLHGAVAPGARVLDAGTGTGILAVAAALLGAGECTGFDIDPHSQPSAEDLARSAGVEGRCRFLTGGFERIPAGAFDLVVANIYSDILQAQAGRVRSMLAPGGRWIASGVPTPHDRATRAAFERAGLVLERHVARGRWQAYCGVAREPLA